MATARSTSSTSTRSSRRPDAAGADAVHPGFGFLAENADFAEAVLAAGIRWVGPPPAAIRAMGDKAAARRLAASLGVPVIAGYDGDDQADDTLVEAADADRLPAAGQARGRWRRQGDAHGSRAGPARSTRSRPPGARRRAAFGDDRLVLERLIEGGRHVEIQVLFDAHGAGVQLGERDCSIQRRHQKVLEETPSPAVGPALRQRLGDAALTLARAVGYVSAGTCEFLVDDRGEPAFLEMNTRLQVEHPVTELVTGRDLVADQLRIAAGEPLGFEAGDGDAATRSRSACTPRTPRTGSCRRPGASRRCAGRPATASGSMPGSSSAPRSAAGSTRCSPRSSPGARTGRAALDRLQAALDETLVLGVVTNLRFLRWLVRQPVVRAGEARTDTLDRIWPPDDWAERAAIPAEAWAAAAAAPDDADADPHDDWGGGWRLNASRTVRLDRGRAAAVGRARRRVVRGASASATPSTSTSPAAASRSRSRHRPTWTPRPGRPSRTGSPARPDRPRSSPRCRAPSSASTPPRARRSSRATRSSPSRP